MARPDEFTFLPLGGVGEIGMNLSVYGIGNRHQKSFLAVDLGVSFGDEEHLPGIDLVMPDIGFLERERAHPEGVTTFRLEGHRVFRRRLVQGKLVGKRAVAPDVVIPARAGDPLSRR